MTFRCPLCGGRLETIVILCEGQHVRCPYCNRKFAYSSGLSDDGNAIRVTMDAPGSEQSKVPTGVKGCFVSWIEQWHLIFTWKGEISRLRFVQLALMNLSLYFIVDKLNARIVEFLFGVGVSGWVWNLIDVMSHVAMAAIMLSLVSTSVRRLRDAGCSLCWIWMFLAFGLFLCFSPWFWLAAVPVLCCLKHRTTSGRRLRVLPKMIVVCIYLVAIICYLVVYEVRVEMTVRDAVRKLQQRIDALPFQNISWMCIQEGRMNRVYMFMTDGPARAKYVAVYIMGSLTRLERITCEDAEKADQVEKYIREHFEMEAMLQK